jgi:pSer/pThr/pTyr-binding forkhead associated (FHA) protein
MLASREPEQPSGPGPDSAHEVPFEEPEFLFCCTSGERIGEEYLVGKDGLTVGRRITHTIVLNETSVSMDHAMLRLEGGKVRLHDCDSRNGVLINGLPISGDHTLTEGDTVQIGAAKFQLRRRGRPRIPGSDVIRRLLLKVGGEQRQRKPEMPLQPAALATPDVPLANLAPEVPAQTASRPYVEDAGPEHPADRAGRPGVSASDGVPRTATPTPAYAREPQARQEPRRRLRARAAPAEGRGYGRLLVRVMSIVGPLSIIVASALVYYNHQLGSHRGTSPGVERGTDLAVLGLYMEANRSLSKAKELWQQEPAPDERQTREALALVETAISRYKKALEMELPEKNFREIERELAEALRLREQMVAASLNRHKP